MAGTDIHDNIDSSPNHDHSYYGNGCATTWRDDPPLNGGSTTVCHDRIITTQDSENQTIGVYYNYLAGTSGSGDSSLETNYSNSPDTFCPLGWQLPYGGTGGDYYDKSKSWKYLFDSYNYLDDSASSIKSQRYPISFILSGNFSWSLGALYSVRSHAVLWSITVNTSSAAFRAVIQDTTRLRPSVADTKVQGDNLRCL